MGDLWFGRSHNIFAVKIVKITIPNSEDQLFSLMGNSQNKSSQHRGNKESAHTDREGPFTSQFSLSHFVGNLSGRSFVSVTSNQSVYSASRPWSRVSRRRWNDSTLKNPLEASKTAWPVAHKESIFLPEFPITADLLQKDFQFEDTIAKGAFGKVYKVTKLSDNKEYALKVLSKAQIVNENAVRQVKEEARIQTICGHHSFIARAVSRWQTKKRLYIVSEYIPGGELLALLDRYGKLPLDLVKIFVAEIAIAIDFLHNAGVIYRDLKPENILLDADYHVRLIDFGLSKWLSIGSRTSTLCGTLKYMAPEVLGREPYGHAVDWWSLGVIACRMLTNEYPVPAVIPRATADSGEAGEASARHNEACENSSQKPGTLPKSAEDLPNPARGLLMRLLERDPRVRMRNLRQLQQSAFYMGFNFEHVKAKKVNPKSLLDIYYPEGPQVASTNQDKINDSVLASFDQ
ncbi:serine/threonine-protein kinase S6KL isoform X1 [Ostrinia furnacalis]|uniref:serine/threonine-protein kinase S6KL isoform X1 n=1 Tax=Ostrinia furnacalis TaxID=93504 RepID=UPI00104012E2|nr:serine/threonine-protein kinase S6KL isoform X1 [Ostrinia furnacalis]